jgi:hypothetical protein
MAASVSAPDGAQRLVLVGLHKGEAVRFRRVDAAHWTHGHIAAMATDGSITLHDGNGSARSLRPERLEVRRPGRRGHLVWRNVAEVALTWEQLCLW